MKRLAYLASCVLITACSGSGGDLSEADIANRATAISQSANATVAGQIADIEQKSAEDVSAGEPSSLSNSADTNIKK